MTYCCHKPVLVLQHQKNLLKMNIIVGASGQVGSILLKELVSRELPVRAVVRDPGKVLVQNLEIEKADLFHEEQVVAAFKGGTTAFLLTPENPGSDDVLEDTRKIIRNYKVAIKATEITKVVALSCIGAHINGNTGNVLMSQMLEQELEEMDIERVYIRPSYYFSNWLAYLDTIRQYGIMPTFFPEDLKIEMLSPVDLARFIADEITRERHAVSKRIQELTGPQRYSSREVASVFSEILDKPVNVQPIPPENWLETLHGAGFSDNAAKNLAAMTKAVIDHKLVPQKPKERIQLSTPFAQYLEKQLKK